MSSTRRPVSPLRRAAVEALESRQLFATIAVTTTAAHGFGCLLDATRNCSAGDIIDLRGVQGTIAMDEGLFLDKNLTFIGPGSDRLTITGTAIGSRLFYINAGLTTKMSGFRIDDAGNGQEPGGGIVVFGDVDSPGKLTMNDVFVSNCSAGEYGGGLAADATDVKLTDCRFAGNTAAFPTDALGGGVYVNAGSLAATNCTFDYNLAHALGTTSGNAGADTTAVGGAVALLSASASSFTNCTFANNVAKADHGVGPLSVAQAVGGGLCVMMFGDLTVLNCTFAYNAANGFNADGFGGGFDVFGFGADSVDGNDTLKVVNNVLAGNAANTAGPDAFGLDVTGFGIADLRNNVVGVANDSGIANGIRGNRAGSNSAPLDARLGSLAMNGGKVPTIAPQAGSPVIGAASGADAPQTDARGYPRAGPFDAGAYEQANNYAPTLTVLPGDAARADGLYQSTVAATDVDGDPIAFTLVSGPSWLNIDDHHDGTATLSGTPTLNDIGDNAVVLRASDGGSNWDQSFTLSVAYDTVTLNDGVLKVAGTDAADAIHVWQPAGAGGAVRVVIGKRIRNYAASAVSAIQIFGLGDDDVITGNCADYGCYIQAGDGDDTLIGGEMADSLTGAAGDDAVYGMGGDDWMDGNGGRDALYGGDGNDRCYGGNGRDVIDGGAGSDVLYGEAGPDHFICNDGTRDRVFGGEPDINFVQGDSRDILYDATLLA